MAGTELYSLNDVSRILGENVALIGFLVNHCEIPHNAVAKAKVVDAAGLARIKRELAEYRRKTSGSGAAPPAPRGRKPKPETAA